MNLQSALYGSLLGTAVGDAYGLPFEGMKPQRIRKIFKRKTDYRLIPFMHGAMVSDDTEHATMAVQAYIRSAGQPEKFQQALQSHLRWWLARLPAGIGLATLRSIVKMWFRLPETGVFSAGNGGAMRVAVLGVLARDVDELKQLVKISTRVTHTDPKAEQGALTIALLAWVETHQSDWATMQVMDFVLSHIQDNDLIERIKNFQPNPRKGVSGYIYETVPAVCQIWQQHRHEPILGLQKLIEWGGDTDTTCAIFGGVVGIRYGQTVFDGIAGAWCEPVLHPDYWQKLATQASQVQKTAQPQKPLVWANILILLRNVFFTMIVLAHGFRRLWPPY